MMVGEGLNKEEYTQREMKRGNKRGQLYLIAALIIVFVIIGFFSLGNYAKKQKTDVKIYDIAKELEIETGNVYISNSFAIS